MVHRHVCALLHSHTLLDLSMYCVRYCVFCVSMMWLRLYTYRPNAFGERKKSRRKLKNRLMYALVVYCMGLFQSVSNQFIQRHGTDYKCCWRMRISHHTFQAKIYFIYANDHRFGSVSILMVCSSDGVTKMLFQLRSFQCVLSGI